MERKLSLFNKSLSDHIHVLQGLTSVFHEITSAIELVDSSISSGEKVFVCGNGGSAADAQHFATELTVRFEKSRRSYPAIALTTDTSALTAITNDLGPEKMFSRQLEGLANGGDVLIAISTSGNSMNVLHAVIQARLMGVKCIGLLGAGGGEIISHVDIPIVVPSNRTARIQEAHIFILHFLCETIENDF